MGAGWGRGGALQGRAHCTGTRALSHSNSLQVPSLALRRSLPEPSHSVQTEPSRPRRAGALHGRASWARSANRAAVCPWPQGARSEDSASPAARARPPSGTGGPDPVNRGPRLSLPAFPGSLASGSGCTARSGERGRGKAGLGGRNAPRLRTMPKPRAAGEEPSPPLQPATRRAWVSFQPGPGVTLAQTDPGRLTGP